MEGIQAVFDHASRDGLGPPSASCSFLASPSSILRRTSVRHVVVASRTSVVSIL